LPHSPKDVSDVPLFKDMLKEPIRIEDGYAEVPDGPGLGIELGWDRIEKVSSVLAHRSVFKNFSKFKKRIVF